MPAARGRAPFDRRPPSITRYTGALDAFSPAFSATRAPGPIAPLTLAASIAPLATFPASSAFVPLAIVSTTFPALAILVAAPTPTRFSGSRTAPTARPLHGLFGRPSFVANSCVSRFPASVKSPPIAVHDVSRTLGAIAWAVFVRRTEVVAIGTDSAFSVAEPASFRAPPMSPNRDESLVPTYPSVLEAFRRRAISEAPALPLPDEPDRSFAICFRVFASRAIVTA